MLPSLAAASPTPGRADPSAAAAVPRRRSRKESRSSRSRKGARSLELGRWEARNGVDLPPRGASVADVNASSGSYDHVPHAAIAHFNQTMGGGQALMNVTLNLPEMGQLRRNGYILSGLTRSENEDATAKLMLLRDLGMVRFLLTLCSLLLTSRLIFLSLPPYLCANRIRRKSQRWVRTEMP